MVRHGSWTTAAAIAPKIGADHSETFGQEWRDVTPHQMRFGKSVQQYERRTAAATAQENRRLRRLHLQCFKVPEPHATLRWRSLMRNFGLRATPSVKSPTTVLDFTLASKSRQQNSGQEGSHY
jgi:hypothetical protein